jgi:hypothetical protein
MYTSVLAVSRWRVGGLSMVLATVSAGEWTRRLRMRVGQGSVVEGRKATTGWVWSSDEEAEEEKAEKEGWQQRVLMGVLGSGLRFQPGALTARIR